MQIPPLQLGDSTVLSRLAVALAKARAVPLAA
jgi:hypothetical protein